MAAKRKERTCSSCGQLYSAARLCCPECGEANDLSPEYHSSRTGLFDLDVKARFYLGVVALLVSVLVGITYYFMLRGR